jgi:hypothetical protein|tara:strand:- start:6832 stop:7749 length:918 start_codon:yes stop_codon:yes gene_type:complete
MTLKEILSTSQLDWEVEKVPLFSQRPELHFDPHSTWFESGYYGIRRTDNMQILGVCTKQYQETQNEQIVERAMQIAEAVNGDYTFHKALALNGGKKIFVQLKIENSGGEYDKYIFVVDSNDGSIGLSYGISNTVLSCANQLFLFASKGKSVKHTKSIDIKADEIALDLQAQLIDIDNKIIDLKHTSASDFMIRKIVKTVMKLPVTIDERLYHDGDIVSKKTKNRVDKLLDCIAKETTEKGDTLWGLLNGVTYYTNHEIKNMDRDPSGIEKLLFSNANKMNQIAWNCVTKKGGVFDAMENKYNDGI